MNKYERPVVVTKPRSHNVWLFERPYRVDALIRCREAGLSGRKYWEELALWWKDSENIFQNKAKWRKLWRAPDKGEYAMEENDRSDFASLPEQIAVYRGCRRKDDRGWSWTIDREPNFSPIVPAPRERDRDMCLPE